MKVNGISLNSFGNGQPEDQYLYVDNGASPRRGLRLRYSDFQWQSSNDGITWENINNPYVSYHRGYYAGGYNSGASSEIDGVEYYNDTAVNPTASLSLSRSAPVTSAASSKGYISSGSSSTRVDKFDFSTEGCSQSSYSLSVSKDSGGAGNSSTKGYVIGGTISGDVTAAIEAILYSNDTVSTISSSLQQKVGYQPAYASSNTIAYVSGGAINTSVTNTNLIQKLMYSSETTGYASSNLSVAKRGLGGGNSSSNMYIFGGYTNTYVNTIERMSFSNEASSALSATLSSTVQNVGVCDSASASYVSGGYPGYLNTIRKFLFSDETISNLSATLNTGRSSHAGTQSLDIAW